MQAPTTRGWKVLPRLLAVLALTLAAGVGLAGPAAAHNVLIGSDPADGATLQAAPTEVQLTFDQPVQNFEPIVTVVGPDGQRHESGAPAVDSTVVSTDIDSLTVAGSYVVAYRVVSADGHPVQGEITFELAASAVTAVPAGGGADTGSTAGAAPGASTTDPVPSPVAATPVSAGSGLSGWVWAAIGLAAILVVTAIAVILRRPRPE